MKGTVPRRERKFQRDVRAVNFFAYGSNGTMDAVRAVQEAQQLGLFDRFANVVGFDSNASVIAQATELTKPYKKGKPRVFWTNFCRLDFVELPAPPYIGADGYGRNPDAFAQAEGWWGPTAKEVMTRAKEHVFRCGYRLSTTINAGSYAGSHRKRLEAAVKNNLGDTGFLTQTTISITSIPSRNDPLAFQNFRDVAHEIPGRNDITIILDNNSDRNREEQDRLSMRTVLGIINASKANQTQPATPDIVSICKHDDTQLLAMNVIENSNPEWRRPLTWRRSLDPDDGARVLYSQVSSVVNGEMATKTGGFNPTSSKDHKFLVVVTPYSYKTYLAATRPWQARFLNMGVVPLWSPTREAVTTTGLFFQVSNKDFADAVGVQLLKAPSASPSSS